MAKLTIVNNETKPLKQRVRDALRENNSEAQCFCGSRTYTYIYTGTAKQRVCVFCLMDKRIVEM